MELSESVLKGLQALGDPVNFDMNKFTTLSELAFRGLLSSESEAVLDHPDLKQIDPIVLKHCHIALTTFILESVKQNADKSTVSSCLEDVRFDTERADALCTLYQVKYGYLKLIFQLCSLKQNKTDLENLLSSIDKCPPHITDVSWRLEYCMKNAHVHKVNQPSYLISFSVENGDNGRSSEEELNFSCTMEQLQDLVGKMKDAAKSIEKAMQL
ncbi:COMM domain-containing protein 3 isoform X1 [Chanos chanos]|uniref:COMM domain-containing protein 3 n=1 Tax=Chanos chanos TaxID=29144 RepID=A0A6J2UX72_CHACN|nr:COMM domain-containing protein 3 isoform X1 [Chanos chanos]